MNHKSLSLTVALTILTVSFKDGNGASHLTDYSLCGLHMVELFSCELKSARSVALCLTKKPPKPNLLFIYSDKNNKKELKFNNAQQLIGSASAGGSMIIKGENNIGYTTIYLDTNTAEPSGTFIKTELQEKTNIEMCIPETINQDLNSWNGPKDDWGGGFSIWALTRVGVTKPFPIASEVELWRSWPKQN